MVYGPPPPYPPPQPRWNVNAIIIWTAVVLIALIVGAGLLVARSDEGGGGLADPVACREAMKETLRDTMAAGRDAPTPAPPPACLGLGEAEVEQLMGEVIAEWWDSPEAERLFEDAWRDAVESAYPSP